MNMVIYESDLLKAYANGYTDHLDNIESVITNTEYKIAYELGREHSILEDDDITSLTYLSDSQVLKLIKQKIHGKASTNGE